MTRYWSGLPMHSRNRYNLHLTLRYSCTIDRSRISLRLVLKLPILIYGVISQYEVLALMDLRVTWLVCIKKGLLYCGLHKPLSVICFRASYWYLVPLTLFVTLKHSKHTSIALLDSFFSQIYHYNHRQRHTCTSVCTDPIAAIYGPARPTISTFTRRRDLKHTAIALTPFPATSTFPSWGTFN